MASVRHAERISSAGFRSEFGTKEKSDFLRLLLDLDRSQYILIPYTEAKNF